MTQQAQKELQTRLFPSLSFTCTFYRARQEHCITSQAPTDSKIIDTNYHVACAPNIDSVSVDGHTSGRQGVHSVQRHPPVTITQARDQEAIQRLRPAARNTHIAVLTTASRTTSCQIMVTSDGQQPVPHGRKTAGLGEISAEHNRIR